MTSGPYVDELRIRIETAHAARAPLRVPFQDGNQSGRRAARRRRGVRDRRRGGAGRSCGRRGSPGSSTPSSISPSPTWRPPSTRTSWPRRACGAGARSWRSSRSTSDRCRQGHRARARHAAPGEPEARSASCDGSGAVHGPRAKLRASRASSPRPFMARLGIEAHQRPTAARSRRCRGARQTPMRRVRCMVERSRR